MAKKPKLISDQLREAILSADVSRYRIAKEIGVTEALLSRFMNRVGGLGLENIDKIGQLLDLQLVVRKRKLRTTSKGK
jgi:hypothetical protein